MSTRDITPEILASIRDEIRSQTARMDGHERILLRIADTLGTVDGRLERVEGHVESMDGRLERVEGRLERVEGHVASMDGRLERVEGHLERVDGRLSRTEDHVESLVGVAAQVVGSGRDNAAEIEELKRRVEQLERKVS